MTTGSVQVGSEAGPRLASRLRSLAVTLLIQLLVFMALLEVIARVFDPVGVSYYNETARLFDAMIIEEPIGYRFPPGLQARFNGVAVDINEHGMRDRPVPAEKAPGEFRILAIGDSVMFSVGVELEDSIPYQLERLANENAAPGRYFRTLNMGVPSYNTVQELEQLKQVGLSLQPDVAFIYIIPNDLQDKMWVYEKRGNPVVELAQRSYAVGLVFYTARWLVNLVGVSTSPNRELMFLEDERIPMEPDDTEGDGGAEAAAGGRLDVERVLANPAWLNIENSVLEIHRLLQDAGVPLMVFYRPQFRTTYAGRLLELGREHGFAVDKLDPFSEPRWSHLRRADFVNSPIDGHCNPAGCALYAQSIYERLQSRGLLD